jgi:hypothetical protein
MRALLSSNMPVAWFRSNGMCFFNRPELGNQTRVFGSWNCYYSPVGNLGDILVDGNGIV